MAKRSLISSKSLLRLVNVLVILALAGTTGYFYKKYDNLKNSNPETIQKEQNQQIVDEVGKLYSLPKNETPTIGKVSDKAAIKKDYPILDDVENGDYLLIYQNAKKAILYRPSTKKVIKEIPVSIQATLKLKVVGSGAARTDAEKLLTDSKITFTDGGNVKTAVTGIIVVDVSGKNPDVAKSLAEKLKGTVGTLPAGEDTPTDADLAVFIGTPTP